MFLFRSYVLIFFMDNTSSNHLKLARKQRKDIKILSSFTFLYCRDHHPEKIKKSLGVTILKSRYLYCDDCRDFLQYAIGRRLHCPLPDKSSCKHCHIHCYRPGHRDKVKEIMRYSGKKLVFRGRIDLLFHYLF